MSEKSTISYWLKKPGEEGGEIKILTFETSDVPKVGEVVNINTKINREDLLIQYRHLDGELLRNFLRKDEEQVKGDFVVVHVKRWLSISHVDSTTRDLPIGLQNSTTSYYVSYPAEQLRENFEVFVEPFRHTELTETPIAKVRNLFGGLVGQLDLLNLIGEYPDKEKDLLEIFKSNISNTQESINRLRELLNNSDNWK